MIQLIKADNIITQLMELDAENFPQGLQCWINEEDKYNIHIFSILVDDEDQLKAIQVNVRDYIAIYFQGQILKKEIERWNIYQVFFCKQPIEDNVIKMSIEQDKFATRKLVIDQNIDVNISEDAICSMIYNEIFKFEFESTLKELPLLAESLSQSDLEIVQLTTTVNLENEESLLQFVNTICNE